MDKKTTGTRKKKKAESTTELVEPSPQSGRGVMNQSLSAAKKAKQDEFYTQYVDIQKEVEAYLDYNPNTFREKIVYCNCDDPFESEFFRYFAASFNKLGLKRLICTSYDGSPIAGRGTLFDEYEAGNGKRQKPKAIAVIVDHVKDENNDGAADIEDVKLFLKKNKANRIALKGNEHFYGGDFRSPECVEFLKQADIVVTNPPFSLFREYVAQLVEHDKKFLIIGSKNAVTYKEIFPLIKENKMWVGAGFANGNAFFSIPEGQVREFANGVYDKNTGLVKFRNVGWFTNLDHRRRHAPLVGMTMSENLRFSKHKEIKGKQQYVKYANYDAIEVPYTDAIPSDYEGAMGVPVTFLDRYNPDQFEILGSSRALGIPMSKIAKKGTYIQGGPRFYIDNGDGTFRRMYDRLVIRHRKLNKKGKKK